MSSAPPRRPAIPEGRARRPAPRVNEPDARLTPQQRERRLQRQWWLRVPMVFFSPRPVFVALRDESREAVAARQEPILAILLLAGIATVLQTSVAERLLDDPELDGLLIVVWALLGGAFYGIASYWIGGTVLYLGTRGAGVKKQRKSSAIRARHVLGFAAAPIALSLVMWPVRLAVYGSDTFRTGGADTGIGPAVFNGIGIAFILWSAGLLLYGIHTTYRWTWVRAVGTVLLSILALLALVALLIAVRQL